MPHATLLDDLSAAIGFTSTCVIAAWYGGQKLYVPAVAGPDHPLVDLIGHSALRALVRNFPRASLKIPTLGTTAVRLQRDRRACERFAEGWTAARVADDLGIGLRRAEQLRVELEASGWLQFASGHLGRRTAA